MFFIECLDCDAHAETDDTYWVLNHECPETDD